MRKITRIYYVAKDGTEWTDEDMCKLYEFITRDEDNIDEEALSSILNLYCKIQNYLAVLEERKMK